MVRELVEAGRKRLGTAAFEAPGREVHVILGHVLGLSEAQLLARWNDAVDAGAGERFDELLDRRLRGEPVAYLLGRREFYGRDFRVDSRVLIPRPETEHLVETALELTSGKRSRILDLGTGSGCIAITLALEHPLSRVVGGDVSIGALNLAAENARALGAANVRFAASDLASSIAMRDFDLVVSNPPYIGRDEAPALSVEVTGFEPDGALFPPGDADSIIRRLATELSELRSGTWLLFEIGHLQHEEIGAILESSAFELERFVPDYQAIPRVVVARRR